MGLQIKGNKQPGRNDPCPCESGLKFKHCHGDMLKVAVCNRVANEKMIQLIREEQKKRIVKKQQKNCTKCNGLGFVEGDGQSYPCQDCQYISDEERIAEKYKQLTEGD